MQKIAVTGMLFLGLSGFFSLLSGAEDIIGIVKSIPEGKIGVWQIDSHAVEVDEATEFSTAFGPIEVGACVKVGFDDGVAETIESRPENRCRLWRLRAGLKGDGFFVARDGRAAVFRDIEVLTFVFEKSFAVDINGRSIFLRDDHIAFIAGPTEELVFS
jgi:hypothetical protein